MHSSLLRDEERPGQGVLLQLPPRLPYRLVEDMLHMLKVQAGRDLEKQAPKPACQGGALCLGDLPGEEEGESGLGASESGRPGPTPRSSLTSSMTWSHLHLSEAQLYSSVNWENDSCLSGVLRRLRKMICVKGLVQGLLSEWQLMSPKPECQNEAEGKGEAGPKSLARPCLWSEEDGHSQPHISSAHFLGQEMSHPQPWRVD